MSGRSFLKSQMLLKKLGKFPWVFSRASIIHVPVVFRNRNATLKKKIET